MATLPAQSQKWPADRALLFVHGIGNPKVGDYDPLIAEVRTILGDAASQYAFYFLYYDQINEWVAAKLQVATQVASLVADLKTRLNSTTLGDVAADFAGDVIWPVLVADARQAVRAAVLQQLGQIVLDGKRAGIQPRDQHLSIIAHSLGCFHVYEALSAAAADPASGLGPASSGVRLDNLVFMASPVQLIRTVATSLGAAVPQGSSMFTVAAPLAIPAEPGDDGQPVLFAANTVAITGNLDPVGGYLFREELPWAYMNLPGQQSFVDTEQIVTTSGTEDMSLASVLHRALHGQGPPTITPDNPHDWGAYVQRHADDLRQWLAT